MRKGFISYAHDDHTALAELKTHLRAIERAYKMQFWADERIAPGDYWSSNIAKAIDDAEVHILLLSPAFIASDYVFGHELPAINKKCEKGDLVLPVVAERCLWKPWVGPLQAIPVNEARRLVPVTDWKPRKNGFHAVSEQIESAMKSKFGEPRASLFSWGKP